jgi:hypothetical protein
MVRLRPPVLPLIAMLTIILAAGPACHDDVSRTHIKLEDTPADKQEARSRPAPAPPPSPLICPAGGIAPLQASAVGVGNHKVFLKWNPSVASANPNSNAAGYCLYRSETRKAPSKNPTCAVCEQINLIPFNGTSCVDEVVKDGAAYHYVAVAVSQSRQLSQSSNEVAVVIPPGKQRAGAMPAGSYPPCRVPASK